MGSNLWSPTIIQAESIRRDFRQFIREAWHVVEPAPYVHGWHIDALADHLSWVGTDIRFLVINLPPRTSKSLITAVLYPVWAWLQDPTIQFLTGSYSLQLSQRDSLKSRRLIESRWFQSRYGSRFAFSADEKLKRQYSNDQGGRRVCTSTDSTTTGEGGNRLLIDDPHNAKEAESEAIREGTLTWWDESLSSRLNQPNKDCWIVNGQRTAQNDLFGHIRRTADQRQVVTLMIPNEFDSKRKCVTASPKTGKVLFRDPRTKQGELLCPARIDLESTTRLKRALKEKYKLQYQQDEKGGGGKILQRDKWKPWTAPEAPECETVITVYDTAFEQGEDNDYSARTDWGIFKQREVLFNDKTGESTLAPERHYAILIGAWREKLQYHELKAEMRRHYRVVKHDYTLIEKKASGISLCQDLSRGREPIRGLRKVSVSYGGRVKMDKVERANLASVVLDDGLVYYMPRPWAEAVLDECAAFPGGQYDDWVDTVVNALQWLRRMNEVGTWEEVSEADDVKLFARAKAAKRFYG